MTTNSRFRQTPPRGMGLFLAAAALLALTLAGCDTGAAPAASSAPQATAATTPGRPILAAVVATAAPDDALVLPPPPAAAALDPAAGRQMLAELFPGLYTPREQDVYTTHQTVDAVKAFYDKQSAAAGYTPEVGWSDLGTDTSGASWTRQDIQLRVIVTAPLNAARAQSLNTTFQLAATPLQAGDTLIYIIAVDRSKPLR